MTNIKKQFEEIYALLEANQNKKVSTILPELQELMTANKRSTNFKKDEDGNVTHVFCYYHKEWEDVTECEYGNKANTATGLTSMCKVGISQWNKQQKEKKKSQANLINQLANGELSIEDLPEAQSQIEEQASIIVPR